MGECGFVGFVVSVFAPAVHIDDDIAAKGLAVVEGGFHCCDDGKRIIAVNVENRGLDDFSYVGAVAAGAGVGRGGGETDLVVDDDMDRASGAVALQLGEVKDFRHDSLTGDSGVSMDENGEDALALGISNNALTGAGFAFDYGINGFQVTGVGSEADFNFVPVLRFAFGFEAEMVLYITVSKNGVGRVVFGEFTEDVVEGFSEEVSQYVEATPVSHAHDDLVDLIFTATLKYGVEASDEGLSAFEGEAFLPNVAGLEKVFKVFCFEDGAQDAGFVLFAEARHEALRFDTA